jgi:hypothetical protein
VEALDLEIIFGLLTNRSIYSGSQFSANEINSQIDLKVEV